MLRGPGKGPKGLRREGQNEGMALRRQGRTSFLGISGRTEKSYGLGSSRRGESTLTQTSHPENDSAIFRTREAQQKNKLRGRVVTG